MESIPTTAKGSPRKTMGTIAASGFDNASAAPSKNTTLKAKGNSKSVDPAKMAKPSRSATTADGHRAGARYGIKVGFQKQTSPEAGATQGNGRIIAPAINRSRPNFSAGMAE